MKLQDQNVLFFSRTMNLGGTENVILQLCEIFDAKVNKIVVCSCGGVNVEKIEALGIKHYLIPDITDKSPKSMYHILLQIKKIIKNEKITIIHSHHRMAAFYSELAAPKNVVKIANAHNTFQNKKRLTQIAYRNTQVIAVGEMVKKNLLEYFEIPERQIHVIHNAVKAFVEETQIISELSEEKKAGHFLVGNIGRLSEQKGMSYFISAAEIALQSHPEMRFFIIGEGEERAKLEELIQAKQLDEFVTLMGYRSDIQNVMRQLDLIVLSSLWEGLPLTPIEAFSVGKAVVATDVDGTAEIVEDGEDGYLVKAMDVKQIAEKIVILAENPKLRLEMEQNAQKKYLREFSFDKLKAKYLEFYEEL